MLEYIFAVMIDTTEDIIEKAKKKRHKQDKETFSVYISKELTDQFKALVAEGLRGHVIEHLITEFLEKQEKKKSK